MIVINVTYKCKPEMREVFLNRIMEEGIDVACRAETGNIKYDYYLATYSADELLLVEKWTDAEALFEHGEQAHFARLGELKREYVNDTIIEKFQVQG